MRKTDIINALGRRNGFDSYLEICTPTTGLSFAAVDARIFARRDRLLYLCADDFDDGQPITFRTIRARSDDAVDDLLSAVEGSSYDLVFVDAHHTYENSLGDLWAARCLIKPGGIIVMHDCNPIDPLAAAPQYRPGSWSGVSYRAFIDFALSAASAGSCVIDTDEGCGIVFGPQASIPEELNVGRMSDRLAYEWTIANDAQATLYPFFDQNRRALLNLVPAAAFAALYGLPAPKPSNSRSLLTRVRGRVSRILAP